ncbi:hypothetical protein CQA53_00030 [Helicobacter didelphidarum]|uniref:Uncharacterized protein n=1 Tax=Helicobacter didelphidarum TaxID=2040648 RepID=A0A3D8IQ96_9HELI|nr:hypothetical protein [Helicobacter didelphidarum]RDU67457.1 hypothetical protein CQA53_00030 [Helicobacter didelphidarum]
MVKKIVFMGFCLLGFIVNAYAAQDSIPKCSDDKVFQAFKEAYFERKAFNKAWDITQGGTITKKIMQQARNELKAEGVVVDDPGFSSLFEKGVDTKQKLLFCTAEYEYGGEYPSLILYIVNYAKGIKIDDVADVQFYFEVNE